LLAYTRAAVPFAGYVTRKLIYTGDLASEGTPLFELEARTRMRAEVDVPEALPALPVGSQVRVSSNGAMIAGRISEASSAVHPATRTRRVIIELPAEAGVHSGAFVRALWPAPAMERLLVPANAVQLFGQIERVFVVSERRATLRIVKTGGREADRVQILAGLGAGETVVVSPPPTLRDGDPVQVLP
jgi:RND family efflux transporter MFP subunit